MDFYHFTNFVTLCIISVIISCNFRNLLLFRNPYCLNSIEYATIKGIVIYIYIMDIEGICAHDILIISIIC